MDTDEHATWVRFGELVTDRRVELGLTMAEAARLGGFSDQTWSKIERAKRTARRAGTLSGVCRALQWRDGSIEAILAGGDPVPLSDASVSQALRDAIHGAGLDPAERAVFDALVDLVEVRRADAPGPEDPGVGPAGP